MGKQALLFLAILCCGASRPHPPADVSIGSAITDPRPFTGVWEQPSAPGQAVGFDIEILTDVVGAPKSLAGVEQHVSHIWITTYVRTNRRSQRTFWKSDYAATFSWHKDHLVLHQRGSAADANLVDLDLVFDPEKDVWRGTLQNEWFSGTVALQRPAGPEAAYPIAGDWIKGSPGVSGFQCLHVGLGVDNALVIWSDTIDLPGFKIYAVLPASTPERYGTLDDDPAMTYAGPSLLFFTGTYMNGAMVVGDVAADGTTFNGWTAQLEANPQPRREFASVFWQRSSPDCSTKIQG